jgi:hypothetical protein
LSPNFRTDAERSSFKPAGPHLIERSADSPAQTVSRAEVTVTRPQTIAVASTVPAIRIQPESPKAT